MMYRVFAFRESDSLTRANARNVRFETLCSVKFTLSTQLLKPKDFFYAFRFYFKGGSKMTPVQWPYLLITIKLSCGVTPVRSRITKCPDVKEDWTSFLLYYLTCPSFPAPR